VPPHPQRKFRRSGATLHTASSTFLAAGAAMRAMLLRPRSGHTPRKSRRSHGDLLALRPDLGRRSRRARRRARPPHDLQPPPRTPLRLPPQALPHQYQQSLRLVLPQRNRPSLGESRRDRLPRLQLHFRPKTPPPEHLLLPRRCQRPLQRALRIPSQRRMASGAQERLGMQK